MGGHGRKTGAASVVGTLQWGPWAGPFLPAASTRVLGMPMCSGGPGSCAREPASGSLN